MMLNSSHDMLGLVAEVWLRRAPMVLAKVKKKMGGVRIESFLPKQALEGLWTAHKLHARYEQGDYRHDDREVGRLEHICNWLIETAQRMSGHPVRPFTIDRLAMQSGKPCEPGTYAQAIVKVHEEW